MASRRPPRLHRTLYVGFNRYFVTICAFDRQAILASLPWFGLVEKQLLQSSAHRGFSLLAYCGMPDHLHLLVEATTRDADLLSLVRDFKQRTGFAFKHLTGKPLWQDGFHDHVLRGDECVRRVARYLLANPVRAGLVRHPLEWPFLGSDRFELRELLDSVADPRGCSPAPHLKPGATAEAPRHT